MIVLSSYKRVCTLHAKRKINFDKKIRTQLGHSIHCLCGESLNIMIYDDLVTIFAKTNKRYSLVLRFQYYDG